MKPILELVLKGGDASKVVAVACGECRIVAPDQIAAERCCDYRCLDCGAKARQYQFQCDKCQRAKWAESSAAREMGLYDKAKKITPAEYDGDWVFDANRDEYHASLEELVDSYLDDGLDVPEFCYGTYSTKLSLDAESIVNHALEEHHEHADEQVSDLDKLQAALDAWCATQAVESFQQDDSTVILIPEEMRRPAPSEGERREG